MLFNCGIFNNRFIIKNVKNICKNSTMTAPKLNRIACFCRCAKLNCNTVKLSIPSGKAPTKLLIIPSPKRCNISYKCICEKV